MQALIIDDEKHCREGLHIMLSKYCPEVEVMAQCPGARAGIQAIEKFQPDLIFLDIEMPGMDGFELLQNYQEYGFEVIFTTAYNEYAIQAIRHSALDYLLKPVNKNELIRAVAKAQTARRPAASEKIARLLESIEKDKPLERIALPTVDGMIILELDDILYCEGENNYSRFYLFDGKAVMIAKTLKKVETLLLRDPGFVRIHHSFVVNLSHVQRYFKGDGGKVSMVNGKDLPVSRAKKQEFLARLESL